MRVALVTAYSHPRCTLKDVAGGFGTVFEVGPSWPARLLERAKARVADLPPVAFGILGAQLRQAGHDVVAVEVHRHGQRHDPTPGVDAAILWSSIVDADLEVALAEELRGRGTRVIVVGAHASARPALYLPAADAVVVGEAEVLGADLLGAEGLVEAGAVGDLDDLPLPDWSSHPHRRYRYALLPPPTLPLASARGCAYGCTYCPWRVTAPFRERSPARVAEEAAHLSARYGARSVAFRDPLFNLDPERTLALAEHLRPLGLRFSVEARADRLDERLLLALWRAGLRSLEIGVESVDRSMLSRRRRQPPAADRIQHVVRVAQRLGIRVICNYMLGLPEDDEDTIRATVAWAKVLDSFAVQFTVATPYPGTDLADEVAERALPVLPRDHTGFRPVFRHPGLPPEHLARLREWAYVSYHYRPRYARRFARHAFEALTGQ